MHRITVRIAVGQLSEHPYQALPGPTDEVLLGIDALVKGLAANGTGRVFWAEDIAAVLRKRLHEKTRAEADS